MRESTAWLKCASCGCHHTGKKFVEDSLRSLCSKGARMVRLDAYGYVTKKPGTRCFMEVRSAAHAALQRGACILR